MQDMKTKNYIGCMSAYGLNAIEPDVPAVRNRMSWGVLRGNMNDRRDMGVLFRLKLPSSTPLPIEAAPLTPGHMKVRAALMHMGWMDCMNTIRLIKKLPMEVVEVDDGMSSVKKQEGYLRQLPTDRRIGRDYERDDDEWVYWKSEWRDQVKKLKQYFEGKTGISFDQYVFNIKENQYA